MMAGQQAHKSTKWLRHLANHLEHVAGLCETGDADALVAYGRLEKKIMNLWNKLRNEVPVTPGNDPLA